VSIPPVSHVTCAIPAGSAELKPLTRPPTIATDQPPPPRRTTPPPRAPTAPHRSIRNLAAPTAAQSGSQCTRSELRGCFLGAPMGRGASEARKSRALGTVRRSAKATSS